MTPRMEVIPYRSTWSTPENESKKILQRRRRDQKGCHPQAEHPMELPLGRPTSGIHHPPLGHWGTGGTGWCKTSHLSSRDLWRARLDHLLYLLYEVFRHQAFQSLTEIHVLRQPHRQAWEKLPWTYRMPGPKICILGYFLQLSVRNVHRSMAKNMHKTSQKFHQIQTYQLSQTSPVYLFTSLSLSVGRDCRPMRTFQIQITLRCKPIACTAEKPWQSSCDVMV